MKYLLIIFLTLLAFTGFTQSPTKVVKDSIDILIPLDKPVKNSDLRRTLKQIADLKQILGVEPVANPNPNFVDKGNDNSYPYGNIGGIATAFKFRVWKYKNATSYDFVVSKNSDLSNPTNSFNSTSTNAQITGLDSNAVYYWKYRGKNANFTGAWSNTKKFDTYALPLGFPKGRFNSIFDLEVYVPFVTMYHCCNAIPDNQEYAMIYRIGDKQMFNRHVRGTVTNFPYTVQTGLSQIISTWETSCYTFYSWGKQPDYLDINPYLSLVGSTLVLSQPVTTFPISQIDSYVNIFYLK